MHTRVIGAFVLYSVDEKGRFFWKIFFWKKEEVINL